MTVRNPESAAGFLAARADWLAVEAIDRPDGGFDVALVIDGTYTDGCWDRDEVVAYLRDWVASVLAYEGVAS